MSTIEDPPPSTTTIAPKKRKRSTLPPEGEELEIDVAAPEPPSKKALRRAKKGKPAVSTAAPASDSDNDDSDDDNTSKPTGTTTASTGKAPKSGVNAETKRSNHAIWIGNLPFSANKASLQTFLTAQAGIDDAMITRIHMPLPTPGNDNRRLKPQNKGFAYVDFDTEAAKIAAIGVSERLMDGRRVLVKDAKSFEGRPDKKAGETGATAAALGGEEVAKEGDAKGPVKEKSKRVFVGNLGFDVTKEDLEEHYSQAGEIEDVHVATFEDTGKCKGFAWVRFVEEGAAEAAVKGFTWKEQEPEGDEDEGDDDEGEDGAEGKKKKGKKLKPRKWFLNRMAGRTLRCEFAEDSKTRYHKRFGKGAAIRKEQAGGDAEAGAGVGAEDANGDDGAAPRRKRMTGDKDQRQEQRRQKHKDARNIAPGQALANAARGQTGAIVESQGKKIVFE